MTKWIETIPHGLTPAECQAITAHALAHLPAQKGRIGHGGTSVEHAMRESLVRWLKRDDPFFSAVYRKLDYWFMKVNAEVFDFEVSGLPYEVQFSEYRSDTEGHYDWHEDNSWLGGGQDRKLSLIIQLSDPSTYEGGRVELARDTPPEQFGAQGDVLIFPSFLRHRVLPVTAGIRYSLVSWWRGPRLR